MCFLQILFLVIILKIKTIKAAAWGLLIGAVNGMLGAGGGMIAVPVLKKLGMEQKSAHCNAVAVILPLSAVSTVIYYLKGNIDLSLGLSFIIPGVLGSIAATYVMKKISPTYLKLIFGGFMVWAGVRLWLR